MRAETSEMFLVPAQLARLLLSCRPQQIILQIYGTDCLLNLVVYIHPSSNPVPLHPPFYPGPCWLFVQRELPQNGGRLTGRWIRNVSLLWCPCLYFRVRRYICHSVRMRRCECSSVLYTQCVYSCLMPGSHLCVCASAACVFLSTQLSITSPHSSPANPVILV